MKEITFDELKTVVGGGVEFETYIPFKGCVEVYLPFKDCSKVSVKPRSYKVVNSNKTEVLEYLANLK